MSVKSAINIGAKVLATLSLMTWPLLVWLGLTYDLLYWLLPILILLLGIRFRGALKASGAMRRLGLSAVSVALLLALVSYIFNSSEYLLYYPVAVNIVMLIFFATSLLMGMPVIEQLARLQEPSLPPKGVNYTRTVTKVWCVFFVLNGGIALTTVLIGDVNLWTLWNGLLSYLCMGLLFAGEWLVREFVVKKRA